MEEKAFVFRKPEITTMMREGPEPAVFTCGGERGREVEVVVGQGRLVVHKDDLVAFVAELVRFSRINDLHRMSDSELFGLKGGG